MSILSFFICAAFCLTFFTSKSCLFIFIFYVCVIDEDPEPGCYDTQRLYVTGVSVLVDVLSG
jgi:hypothetical protein